MISTEFSLTTSINSDNYFCSKLINNSNESIENFMFCFSILAPVKVIENCNIFKSAGGYIELTHLENFVLKPGQEWNFKYAYKESRHKPMKHTWGPQGGFLKVQNGNII